MKYSNVNIDRYDKIFSTADRTYFQKFIITNGILKANNRFWATKFERDTMKTPTDGDGAATFKALSVVKTLTPMADFVAPFGSAPQIDKDGFAFYTGSIPDVAQGFTTSSIKRWQFEQMFKEFGNDVDIINQYVDSVQKLYDSVNARYSNMSAQLLSTGQINVITGNGRGQGIIHKSAAPIPAANFLTCGSKVWSDPTCNIPQVMADIEQEARDLSGFEGVWMWEIDETFLKTTFLSNTYVQSIVKNYFAGQRIVYDANFIVTYEMLLQAMTDTTVRPFGVIYPIYERQIEQTLTARTRVNGWDETIAVLRPLGMAGVMKFADIPEILVSNNYNPSVVQKTTALLEGGLMGLINYVRDKDGYGEWETTIRGTAIPTLSEFPYHFLVDMTEIDS